jgi:tRNA U34 5-methylaminomethyl-2-thiouridine-forming methyltransferase MnmC
METALFVIFKTAKKHNMHDKSDKELNDSAPLFREVVLTEDGSTSLQIPGMNEMYHSRKGAIKESQHVYIEYGLFKCNKKNINVLEIGMGTGLNVVLTLLAAKSHRLNVFYQSLEPYPLTSSEAKQLNFHELLEVDQPTVLQMHSSDFDMEVTINESFTLIKNRIKLEDFETEKRYDVVYFDAFAPSKQANPWQLSNIRKCYDLMNPGGILVTYCSQGQFKRNLAAVGFEVTNPKGPMGKREITVAYKTKDF